MARLRKETKQLVIYVVLFILINYLSIIIISIKIISKLPLKLENTLKYNILPFFFSFKLILTLSSRVFTCFFFLIANPSHLLSYLLACFWTCGNFKYSVYLPDTHFLGPYSFDHRLWLIARLIFVRLHS